jgi:hypothetical protein
MELLSWTWLGNGVENKRSVTFIFTKTWQGKVK